MTEVFHNGGLNAFIYHSGCWTPCCFQWSLASCSISPDSLSREAVPSKPCRERNVHRRFGALDRPLLRCDNPCDDRSRLRRLVGAGMRRVKSGEPRGKVVDGVGTFVVVVAVVFLLLLLVVVVVVLCLGFLLLRFVDPPRNIKKAGETASRWWMI